MTIPFIDLKSQYLEIKQAVQERINAVLDHGQYIMGPEVRELEGKLADYTGSKHCITVGSGTDALLISLMSLGIGPGDEVITTPFSFVSTVEVIVLLGATPVFVDIEERTCNLNADLLAAKITAQTKAILPVSLYGQPADMDNINAIANAHCIPVIEDAAQSFGATYKGKKSCNLSTIGCTSFFPSKPLGCYGDGGAIFTNDDDIAQACREIRVHGQKQRYVHDRVGIGGRMDTIQCAVVLAKLDLFDWEVNKRQQIAAQYHAALDTVVGQQAGDGTISGRVEVRPTADSVYAQYTVFSEDRAALVERLKQFGIPTAVHYPVPLNQQPAYKEYATNDTPLADQRAHQVVSLPLSPHMHKESYSQVISAISGLMDL